VWFQYSLALWGSSKGLYGLQHSPLSGFSSNHEDSAALGSTCPGDELKTYLSGRFHYSTLKCWSLWKSRTLCIPWKKSPHTRQSIICDQILSTFVTRLSEIWTYFNGTDVKYSSTLYGFNSIIPWNTQLTSIRSTISNDSHQRNQYSTSYCCSFPGNSASELLITLVYWMFPSGEVYMWTIYYLLLNPPFQRHAYIPAVCRYPKTRNSKLQSNWFTPLSMKLTCRLIRHTDSGF
jgi:hypothetical protein